MIKRLILAQSDGVRSSWLSSDGSIACSRGHHRGGLCGLTQPTLSACKGFAELWRKRLMKSGRGSLPDSLFIFSSLPALFDKCSLFSCFMCVPS